MTDFSLLQDTAEPAAATRRVSGLSRGETALLVVVPLVVALIAVALGKDGDWDFANYHWYNAYALLNHRLGFDVAVAHQPTYYNPLIDVPYYWLAVHAGSWAAVFVLGLVQGLNIVPLFFIARASLNETLPHRRLLCMGLALIGVCGATAVSMIGRVAYDNVLSVLVLGGLAALLSEPKSFKAVFLSGLLIGAAAGLKLVEMFYCVGFAAALLVIPGDWKTRGQCILIGAAGGLIGFAVFASYWSAVLWQATGNPFFPYFNQVFHSPLVPTGDYRNTQFLPENLFEALAFPFVYVWDYAHADDVPFRDLFFTISYAAIPIAVIFCALRRCARAVFVRAGAAWILFVFVAASYVPWLGIFAVHRYIVGLEMLSPILIVAAVGLLPWPAKTRTVAIGVLMALALAGGRYSFGARAPLGDPYVRLVNPPSIAHPDNSLILMTGLMPLAYLIPELPPRIPVLRISSYLTDADDHSLMTARMKARADAATGDVYFLVSEFEMDWARNDAKIFGFALDPSRCAQFSTNLGGPYRLCPLTRLQ